MYIIIKNILPHISIDELKECLLPTVKGRFFQAAGHIEALKLIQMTDRKGKSLERHALIRVNSNSIKKRLIRAKSVNLRRSKAEANFFESGSQIGCCNVGEYIIRHWSNDRRMNKNPRSLFATNRRTSERRRAGLGIRELAER